MAGTVGVTNGNLTLGTAGNKLNIATGSNASAGQAQGSNGIGTVVVTTTAVTASSLIFVTADSTIASNCAPGTANVGELRVSLRTAGTSFTVASQTAPSNPNKLCFNWWIIN